MGASVGLKRGMLDDIGLFDEGFFPAFYEETDLCFRARADGYRVVYAPDSRAVHHETTSMVREGVDYHRWMGRGRLRLVLKHYTRSQFNDDFVPAERVWLATLTAPAMRQGLRMAYLDTLLVLRDMPRTGVLADSGSASGIAEALLSLRAKLVESVDLPGAVAGGSLLAELPWHVNERPFTSRVPVVGPIIAGFREVWNSVATKWYVRPLMEQQREVNRRLAVEVDKVGEALERASVEIGQMGDALSQVSLRMDRATDALGHVRALVDEMHKVVGQLSAEVGRVGDALGQASANADRGGDALGQVSAEVDRVSDALHRIAEAHALAQEVMTLLDQEAVDSRRLSALAIYGMREDLARLRTRIDALEAAIGARQPRRGDES